MERPILLGSCLLAAALGASAGSIDPLPHPPLTIGILLARHDPLPDDQMSEMQQELESILDFPGVRLVWRDLEEAAGREVFNWVVVVHVDADDDGKETKSWKGLKQGALGFSHVSDGQVLPFTSLNCGRLRRLLESGLCGEPAWRRASLFGPALGRVLAHEVYHVLARTTAHGYWGVSKPVLTVKELTADSLPLDPCSRKRIEDQLFGGRVKPATSARR
jgi:hypothetical protein